MSKNIMTAWYFALLLCSTAMALQTCRVLRVNNRSVRREQFSFEKKINKSNKTVATGQRLQLRVRTANEPGKQHQEESGSLETSTVECPLTVYTGQGDDVTSVRVHVCVQQINRFKNLKHKKGTPLSSNYDLTFKNPPSLNDQNFKK